MKAITQKGAENGLNIMIINRFRINSIKLFPGIKSIDQKDGEMITMLDNGQKIIYSVKVI